MKKIWVVAMRGRNPDRPTLRVKGIHLEQRLEINEDDICNCLTTVSKDTMILEGYDDNVTGCTENGKK